MSTQQWDTSARALMGCARLSCVQLVVFILLSLSIGGGSLSFSSRLIPPAKTAPAVVTGPRGAGISRSRGTTVPTSSASNLLQKTKQPTRHREVSSIDPGDPFTFGYVKIGKLVGAHGVRGEVKLLLDSDADSHRVKKGGVMYVKKPTRRSPRAVRVLSSRRQGSVGDKQVVFLAQLEGVTTRTTAEAFKQYELYTRDDSIPDTQGSREEYMVRELVGLRCYLWADLLCAGVQESSTGTASAGKGSTDSAGTASLNVGTTPSELCMDRAMLDAMGALSPVAVVVGVVPPEELCDSPAAAKLMHAQLEVQLLLSEPRVQQPAVVVKVTAVAEGKLSSAGQVTGRPAKGAVSATATVPLPGTASAPTRPASRNPATASTKRRKALYCLVPLVPSIVRGIHLPSGVLVLDPPAGLLEHTYELSERAGPIKGFLPAHIGALSAADRAYLADRVAATYS